MPRQNEHNAGMKELPDDMLIPIYHYITGIHNATDKDVTELILKPGLSHVYIFFIIQYGLLSLCGVVLSIYTIGYILRYKLYRDVTQAILVNLSLCHFVQCAFVLPITLLLILAQNWVFGQFMCYFIPILQDIPLHVAILSHLLIAWDRLRWLGDPLIARLPSFVSCCATWLTGMVIALPYPIYTTFLDLGMYIEGFKGVGMCLVNLVDDMQEYSRGLFIIMYCVPSTVLAYLYIRTAKEIRSPEGPIETVRFEHRADVRMRQKSSTSSNRSEFRQNYTRSFDLYDAEMDVVREKRTQRYLGAMAVTHVISISPLMILRLARMVLVETYENTAMFDITYLMFVWMAFLPTVIIPCIYASWILSRPAKERIRRYFRLSSRQSESENKLSTHRSIENSVTQENTTETLDEAIDEKFMNIKYPVEPTVENPIKKNQRGSNKKYRNQPDAERFSRKNLSVSSYSNSSKSNEYGNLNMRSSDNILEHDFSYSSSQRELIHPNHDQLSTTSEKYLPRRESSSTYERDMEIIDLLQRDRSMNIQEACNTGRILTNAETPSSQDTFTNDDVIRPKRSSFERRKLPDIRKIASSSSNSPKRLLTEPQQNFPNLVFTHQQNPHYVVDGRMRDIPLDTKSRAREVKKVRRKDIVKR